MLLEVIGSSASVGAIGVVGGAIGTYLWITLANGKTVKGLVPKETYNGSVIGVAAARTKVEQFPNYVHTNAPDLVKGRSYPYDDLLSFLGKMAEIAASHNVDTADLRVNVYFAADRQPVDGVMKDAVDLVFVPGIQSTAGLSDFLGLVNGQPVRDVQNQQIELLDNGSSMPPPMNGRNLF
jgi:hypothetical protein